MKDPTCILAFSTRNYDATLRFFDDLGFEVTRGGQLCPFFNSGRGSYVRRGDIEFNLEESTTDAGSTQCDLWAFDFSDDDLQRIPQLGFPHVVYDYVRGSGLYGPCHLVTSPGGTFRFAHPIDTTLGMEPACLPAFTTRNYDAMRQFFAVLGFEISDGETMRSSLFFRSEKGAYFRRGDLAFTLEESTAASVAATFNLFLLDISEEEIRHIAGLGRYGYTCEQGFGGPSHWLTSPDGGLVTF